VPGPAAQHGIADLAEPARAGDRPERTDPQQPRGLLALGAPRRVLTGNQGVRHPGIDDQRGGTRRGGQERHLRRR
jgi:hypothetical protein